jgi:DNA-binding XRE family transcriptional regulator
MIEEEKLRELYHEKEMTQAEIAKQENVARRTVGGWMEKYEIETGYSKWKKNEQPNDKTLRDLYIRDEKTQEEISNQFDVTKTTIKRWMEKAGIETRSRRETALKQFGPPKLYLRNGYESFSGDNMEFFHHRLLAVAKYGYEAVINNHIHHKNEIPWDNRPDNIKVLSPADHAKLHHKETKLMDNLLMNELYHNEEKTQKEIAEVFGLSQATVSKRLA